MKEQIGETAGKLWSKIGESKDLPISSIAKVANGDNNLAYLALGWLAREDKVELKEKNSVVLVSLTKKEAEVFKSSRG